MWAPGLLATGTYVLKITGTASGAAGGTYSGAMNLTAVPLPPAAILFGSVLFGFAVVARKRKAGQGALAA